MSATPNSVAEKVKNPRSWALKKANFPPEDCDADRPIAIIDVGDGHGGFNHPLLKGRVKYWPEGEREKRLHGAHSAEIAGVIAQACSGQIVVYDIGTT